MSQSAYIPAEPDITSYATLGYLDVDAHEQFWTDTITKHCFNQRVTVFLPFVTQDIAWKHLNSSAGHYYNVKLALASLLEPNFLANYIQSESHCILLHSSKAKLDSDNVVVLDHHGKLIFSLLKSTYQSFGIVGQSQSKADKQRQKHVVQIDVRDPKFAPGGKIYERLRRCLEQTFKDPIDMVATCYDRETGKCIDIQWPEGMKATKREMSAQFDQLYNADIPTFTHLRRSLSDKPDTEWREQVVQATEWIGLAHIKANRLASDDRPQSFVTLYSAPKPLLSEQTGTLISWQGLVPIPFIRHVAISMRKLFGQQDSKRWSSISVHGFRDSPFTWDNLQHYTFVNGENDYTMIFLQADGSASDQDLHMISYRMLGSHHYE